MANGNTIVKDVENQLGFLHIRASAATDIGQRKENQDSFLMNDKLGLFIIADGMGGIKFEGEEKGIKSGKDASWFASKKVEGIVSVLDEAMRTGDSETIGPDVRMGAPGDPYEASLSFAITEADRSLLAISPADEKGRKVGTTMVAIFFKGKRVYIANVGDSRAYRISSGSIIQLTHDHSVLASKLRTGGYTEEEICDTKKNLITRYVGVKDSELADMYAMTVYPNERFLLCTDGLHNVIDEETMLYYATQKDLHFGCESMVNLARDRGGRDNITAILLEVAGVDEKIKGVSEEAAKIPGEETI